MAVGKVVKVKEYEWTNPEFGMVIKEWKLGNKILCQIHRQGEKYRSGGEYYVTKPHAGFVNMADTFEEAERKAHQWMGWDAEFDEIVSGGKSVMKGKSTRAPSKVTDLKSFKKYLEELNNAEYSGLNRYEVFFKLNEKGKYNDFLKLAKRYADVEELFVNNGYCAEVSLPRIVMAGSNTQAPRRRAVPKKQCPVKVDFRKML